MADNYLERKMAELAERRRLSAPSRSRNVNALPQGYAAVPVAARRIFLAIGPDDYLNSAKTFIKSGCRVAVALESDPPIPAIAEKEGYRFCPLDSLSPQSSKSFASLSALASAFTPLLAAWRDVDLVAISADMFSDAQILTLAQAWHDHRHSKPNISDFPGLLVLISASGLHLESLFSYISANIRSPYFNILGLDSSAPSTAIFSLSATLLWLAQMPAARLNHLII